MIVSDVALNDSDKSLTPPAGNIVLDTLRVEYTATATAGNRTLEVRYLGPDGDVVYATRLTTNITASDVMIVNFSPGAPTVAPTDGDVEGSQHIARCVFNSSWRVQVIDTAAVAAAADDMLLHSTWSSEQ